MLLRHLILCWSANNILHPIQDGFCQYHGLAIFLISYFSTRSWIAAPGRIHCQSRRSFESLWPGELGALHQRDEPGEIMRVWKSDPVLHQHGLETLFDCLLRMKTERCQEDFRHLQLSG